jgi:hypothetical protein
MVMGDKSAVFFYRRFANQTVKCSMWNFLFKLVFCAGISTLAWKIATVFGPLYGPIGLLITAPAWGVSFARHLIEIFPSIKYWAEYAVSYRWHGRYYTFENRQIRFYLIDESIWIPVKDLLPIMEPELSERELRLLGEAHGTIPQHNETGVAELGLLRLIASRTEHRRPNSKMIRFRNWLQQNALPNVRRLPESAANER